MEIMLCSYKTNLWAYDKFQKQIKGNGIALLAKNKKEALKFAKEFEGMQVYEKIGRRAYNYADSVEEIMEMQQKTLKLGLYTGSTIICEEVKEYDER